MVTTAQELHLLNPDAEVDLFEVDLTIIGFPRVIRFCDAVHGGVIQYQGNDYLPWPISISGIRVSPNGPLPAPTVQIFNYENTIIALLDQYDPIGATFTRRNIFRKHLDDGSDPDPGKEFKPEIYTINSYVMDDECTLSLRSGLAVLDRDWPRERVANVRDSALIIDVPDLSIPTSDVAPPTASGTFADVTSVQANYEATVNFSDAGSLVRYDSVNDNDVRLTGPNGYSQLGVLVTKSPSVDSAAIQAVYSFPGSFNSAANGAYEVATVQGQVVDTAGNAIEPRTVGGFVVNIVDNTPPMAEVFDDIPPSAEPA